MHTWVPPPSPGPQLCTHVSWEDLRLPMGGAGGGKPTRPLPYLWEGLPRTETEEIARNRRHWEERQRPTLSRAVPSPQYNLSGRVRSHNACAGTLGRRKSLGLQEKKKARGRGCVKGVLMDSEQSPRVSRSCSSPQRSEGFVVLEDLRSEGTMLWECPAELAVLSWHAHSERGLLLLESRTVSPSQQD